MFGIVADLLTYILTVLFPVFASYKALRTSDPAQLSPWLMYFVVLALVDMFEAFTYPVLSWVPLYSWFRLAIHVYLMLPSSQGATLLYQTYVHPFLFEYEVEIEQLISEGHDKAKKAGLQYLERSIEYVKVNILGMQPKRPNPPASRQASYAQNLLARFNLPSAREGLAAPAGDFYALVTSALQQATSSGATGREAQAQELGASGTLFPPEISSQEAKLEYISAQRDRLRVLLRAFDKEADALASRTLPPPESSQSLTKSKSELEFDNISPDDIAAENVGAEKNPAAVTGGWMPWSWRGNGARPSPAKVVDSRSTGRSSGVDPRA